MEDQPGQFQKTVIKQYPARSLNETAESRYWRRFRAPVLAHPGGAITCIDFSPVYPYNYAVTALTNVLIYDARTRKQIKTWSPLKEKTYSGTFRSDGRLLVVGGEGGRVQVFDPYAGNKDERLVRQLKGHERPVHTTRFAPSKFHVLSGSDDATVRWWDITTEEQLFRLDGHTDYVRSSACSPSSSDTWATGSYDHTCRIWDIRSQECTMTLDHGAPVEATVFLPGGSLLATAGGTEIRIWSMLAGGRLLARLANHQKTVTSLAVAPLAGPVATSAPRLISGSLDAHVKVYELDAFKVTHVSKYPSPVLSVAISPNAALLAVGMENGQLSVRKHSHNKGPVGGAPKPKKVWQQRLTAATYRYFERGTTEKPSKDDVKISQPGMRRLAPYDHMLRHFQYRAALDAAVATEQVEVVVNLLEELAARSGLSAALGGRDAQSLLPLLTHLVKHLSDPRHSDLFIGITNRILDIYAPALGVSEDVDAKLRLLRERAMLEAKLQTSLVKLQGTLEPILHAALSQQPVAEE
ncbi:U3 small nucleolar RNA-associated protein 15 homolog [Coccomyxa sp. Obi]|nr:U3 small nucleolar RNA-associated protein 15 homolog [Coccomyxa sp. Obi]